MKKLLAMSAMGLIVAGLAFGQDAPPPPEGGQLGPGKRRGQGPERPKRIQGIGQMFKTMHALRAISRELTEEQKARFEEIMAKLGEKMKTIQEEFETDLAGILTPEQMQKFKEAKETPFGPGMGGRGRRGGAGQGPGQGPGGPEGARRDRGQMLKRMDADGDGKVSKDEFRGPEQMFDRLDADKDGFISQEEAKAMGGRRRGRRGPEGGGQGGGGQEF
ncbi:MAG: EF-hand domain-containing protein [Planctomycetes bacterium]|nr:EF-hand domain-containing protein [Planctomycetota bacterium]